MTADYKLERFVDAQEEGRSYESALGEIRRGRKSTHWIWYVFPQIAGLGRSDRSVCFAISSLDEARAYLAHPLLGARLREITSAANAHAPHSAREIFGIDDVKFHSSVTLFSLADPGAEVFREALDMFFDAKPDAATLKILEGQSDSA